MRNRLKFGIFLTLATITLPISSVAEANRVVTTIPEAGSVKTEQPNSVSITSEAALSKQGNQIVVNDPNGIAVDDASITIMENTAIVGLTQLTKTGVYTVNYTLQSKNDDPLIGSYTFLFNAPSKLAAQTPEPTTTPLTQEKVNSNSGSNAFVYTLLILAVLVFIFLIWYTKVTFGGAKKSKRK